MADSVSSIGSSIITSMGIGNYNPKTIAEALANAETIAKKTTYEQNQTKYTNRLTGFNQLKTALTGVQTGLADLAKAANFSKSTVSSTDSTAVSATTTGTPSTGSYEIEVMTKAQAHTLAAAPVSSQYNAIGTGTLNLSIGGSSKSITIDSSNNSLLGLKNSINSAGLPVNASIVNDGSGYRLVMTGQQTGVGNTISMSAVDDDANNTDTAGLSLFSYGAGTNNMTQVINAQDASFKVNGLTLSSSTNQAAGVIDGITLNLNKAAIGTTNTVSVSQDTTSVSDSVASFVADFNAMKDVMDYLGSYAKDAEDPVKGSLAGDSTLSQTRQQMRSMLNFRVSSGAIQSMADIGVTTNRDGSISLDNAKLTQALSADANGVARLFAAVGQPSDAQVKFTGSSDKTVEGTFNLNVNQIAQQAMYLGSAASGVATDPITIDGTNNSFAIKINATSSSNISLAQGSYTRETLATMLESAINNDTNLKAKGLGVTANFDSTNNRFEFVTKAFGSTSKIDFTSVGASMAATLGINTGAGQTGSYAGKDVMGSLTNAAGQSFTFLGTGQQVKISSFLPGAPKDLQFDVLGGATGDRGSIVFNKGYASGMTSLITKMLDTKDGLVGQRITGVETGVTKVKEDLKKLDDRYNLLVQRYTNQFGMVNALQEQMSSLASSLAASFGRSTA